MIDFHSHILPKLDDGSRDVSESVAMLKMHKEQGVTTVIATPHFFANDESVDEFIERRQRSFESLQKELFPEAPKILLGAEVKYYSGISRLSDLKKLCIGQSKLLLLEMPMSRWTEYTVNELLEMSGYSDVIIVLAHIDRYLGLQEKDVWRRLYRNNILMQVNASFFTDLFTRRKALRMLCDNMIHFVGSDCHSLAHRPPNMGKAVEIINSKIGEDYVNNMIVFSKNFFSEEQL